MRPPMCCVCDREGREVTRTVYIVTFGGCVNSVYESKDNAVAVADSIGGDYVAKRLRTDLDDGFKYRELGG